MKPAFTVSGSPYPAMSKTARMVPAPLPEQRMRHVTQRLSMPYPIPHCSMDGARRIQQPFACLHV